MTDKTAKEQLKRGFDILCASAALPVFLPVYLILAPLIRRDGGPVFHVQKRIGRNGKLFPCYKFRSMIPNAQRELASHLARNHDAATEWNTYQKLQYDIRVTKLGKFIRRTSLDELPQILNVLRGDMSIVGPRPITPQQRKYFGEHFSPTIKV